MKKFSLVTLGFVVGIITTVAFSWAYYFLYYESEQKSDINAEVKGKTDEESISKELIINVKSECENEEALSSNVCYPFVEEETTFGLLNNLKDIDSNFYFDYKEYPGIGVMITSINGYTPDSNKAFWKFEVNGNDAQVGVSDYRVKQGDVLKFVVTEISF